MHSIEIEDKMGLYNKYTNDYRATGSERYKDFSKHSPFSIESVLSRCRDFSWNKDRGELCRILEEYAEEIDAPAESLKSIERLSSKNCFAVVTGHQPALFGGALFVLLKIASTISLTNKLNSVGSEFEFVPVFWNASEDHNSSEFSHISVYDSSNDLNNFEIDSGQDHVMANDIDSAEFIEFIDKMSISLPQTEFLDEIMNELKEAYVSNIGMSFSRLISKWFDKYGLIVIEPHCLRSLAKPLISAALSRHSELVTNMQQDSKEMLDKGFSLQLPDANEENTFVFYLEKGMRYRIKYMNGKFEVPELEISYSLEEIQNKVASEPEKFSPVAGLRPIIQACIFPVPMYIAGGGELAYHFQLRSNFKALGEEMPLIIPRAAGTFITPSMSKSLTALSIPKEEILSSDWSWEAIEGKLIESNREFSECFSRYYQDISNVNALLTTSLANLEFKNINDFKREADKYISRIENLQKRMVANRGLGGEDAKKRYFKLRKYLLPSNKYQELSIAGLYFYSLLGKQFFDTICSVDIFSSAHKLWMFD